MNKAYVATAFIFLLCLSSCSMPIKFWVLNNSNHNITVINELNSVVIKPQRSKIISGLDYNFKVTTNNHQLTYKVQSVDSNHIHWSGWGPFLKRMFYVQFEHNYKIHVLASKTKNPITEFIVQPEGFPLEPST